MSVPAEYSKPAAGRRPPFVVTEVVAGRSYADTTSLDGADLTVHHQAEPHDQGSRVVLRAWLEGPREAAHAEAMGGDVQASLDRDLRSLATLLERDAAAPAPPAA